MLILTRKKGEKITIDGNIVITILRYGHGYVKVGIEAPEHINVVRNEIIGVARKQKPRKHDENINLNIKNDMDGNSKYEHDR